VKWRRVSCESAQLKFSETVKVVLKSVDRKRLVEATID
jgi:hypothetical protein